MPPVAGPRCRQTNCPDSRNCVEAEAPGGPARNAGNKGNSRTSAMNYREGTTRRKHRQGRTTPRPGISDSDQQGARPPEPEESYAAKKPDPARGGRTAEYPRRERVAGDTAGVLIHTYEGAPAAPTVCRGFCVCPHEFAHLSILGIDKYRVLWYNDTSERGNTRKGADD